MPSILKVSPHLTPAQLVARFKKCPDADERLRWQAVMLKAEGRSAKDIADVCKRKEDWVRRTVRAYNEGGPDALSDGRAGNGRARVLDEAQLAELVVALREAPTDGGLWTAPKVAAWIEARTGTHVDPHTGWLYLRRAGFSQQVPRPKHPEANEEDQAAFKKGGFRAMWSTSFENIPASRSKSGPRTKPGSG